MVLIVGGRGQLGSKVTEKLLLEDTLVRVMTRTPEKAARLAQLGAEVVAGDLRDADSLERACKGVESVVAAAHSFFGRGSSSPQQVDALGNMRLIDMAARARVKHFVFISSSSARPDHPVDFFRIKYQVEEHLKASGLSYTTVRPPAFMETWAGLIGEPILKRGSTTLFGPGTNPINFMAVEDVAHYVLVALHNPELRNRTLAIGGPENLTLQEVAGTFERARGSAAKTRHLPLALLRFMSTLARPFHAGVARVMATSYQMETTDQRFEPAALLREFPHQLTRLESLVTQQYRPSSPTTPPDTLPPATRA